jgi:hypothetical protein
MRDWSAWGWDAFTAAWVIWMAAFLVIEFAALWLRPGQELTAHLRPVFHAYPITWFLALGLWLWLGVHFLWPSLERFWHS